MTLGELFTKYYYERVAGLSPQTRDKVDECSHFWHKSGLADVDIHDLTAIEIGDALVRGRFESTWDDPQLYRKALVPLRTMWRWAQKEGYISLPFPAERIYRYWYQKIVKGGVRRMLPKPPVSLVAKAVAGQRII
jgi:hypothetical protein